MSTGVALNPLTTRSANLLGWARDLFDQAVSKGREPVSPLSAAAFRIIFGILGVAAVIRFAAKGWIDELYVTPWHHFSYYGFGWVQAWPGWGMYLHFALLGLAALGVALGYRWRLSAVAFLLLFTYAELIDQTTYLNHYYLVSVLSLMMVFLPLANAASLDNRRGQHGGAVPRAVVWTLRVQVGLVYVFAGIAKLNPDWLLHGEPLRIWLYNSTDTPLIGAFTREVWLPYAMSWAGAAFDLSIVPFLLWRRTRLYAYLVLLAFHVATAVLFPSIGMFPWIMAGAALIFFDPDWPSQLAQRMRNTMGKGHVDATRDYGAPSPAASPMSWQAKAAVVVVAAVLAVQVVAPLRHLAYPGNVRWTEEGYQFSWRVLVTEKTGMVKYRVSSGTGEDERLVYPDEYLTPLQVDRMAYQPSLILATAHIIRDDFRSRGHADVQVRVDAFATYNGRPAVRLIDPAVDLARVRNGPGHKPWILAPPT